MLSKDFPTTHDIRGGMRKKTGKQVGSQPQGWGSLYVAESENCAVKELTNGEWTLFKVGLASDGEQSSFKILGDQRTGNSGDYDQVRNYPVKNVGRTEALAHQIWRGEGYSTIKGMDFNVPDEFKRFFKRQRGGTEWFCCPRELLLKEMDLWYSDYRGRAKRVWTCDWMGQTHVNPPIIFQFNEYGLPEAANMKGRKGRPLEQEALDFAWDYRVLTGFAPKGCCSLTV